MLDDLDEADHVELFHPDDGAYAGGPHTGAGAAEEICIWPEAAQSQDQAGRGEVAGGFTS
ncbi:hypothetical protein F183_A13030 [Bryobacterales bacterium F-183]|nr:hypothetical protein F183_A13030 [Bryobacterales bacterium F-183]